METNRLNRLTAWLEAAWLKRYLDRQLTAEEVAWFETYVIDKPDLLRKIDADSDLRDGVVAAERTVPSTTGVANKVTGPSAATMGKGIALRRRPVKFLAIAASLVACVAIGGVLGRAWTTQPRAPEILNGEMVVADAVRGSAGPMKVQYSEGTSPYVFVRVGVRPDASEFRLQISDQADLNLQPDGDGFLNFAMSRSALIKTNKGTLHYMIGKETHSKDIQFEPKGR